MFYGRNLVRAFAPVVVLAAVASAAPAAHALMGFSKVDVVVPRFNGDAYTGYQQKVQADAPAELKNTQVGKDYEVDACLVGKSSICLMSPWVRVGDSKKVIPIKNAAGETAQVRIRFSNDALTRVNVSVKGEWRAR